MKKSIFITLIGIMLFGGCMVNVPDYAADIKNETQTEETTPEKEDEPATEETTTEPQAPEIKATRKRAIPETEDTETEEAEPEETEPEETEEADTSSEVEEQKVVDWIAFYNRVLKKGQETYNKKLPWDSIAKGAKIRSGSWMVDAGSCKRNPPTEEEVRKIADALGTSYEWLLYGEE